MVDNTSTSTEPDVAQLCVDRAMNELGLEEMTGREYELARCAAQHGMRLAASRIADFATQMRFSPTS